MDLLAMFAACGLASYLLGAVPFGFLVARARGVDIRRVGSGNIGATNVARCVGKAWGALVLLADAGKGYTAAGVLPALAARIVPDATGTGALSLVCAALAVIGHNWPVYLGFRGGKGVATSAGALLALAPRAMLTGLAAWIVLLLSTGYVSVASMGTAVVVCAAAWILYARGGLLLPAALTLLAALAIWRHGGNIRRLVNGTENRFALPWSRRR